LAIFGVGAVRSPNSDRNATVAGHCSVAIGAAHISQIRRNPCRRISLVTGKITGNFKKTQVRTCSVALGLFWTQRGPDRDREQSQKASVELPHLVIPWSEAKAEIFRRETRTTGALERDAPSRF
jgi:hypothetical protein